MDSQCLVTTLVAIKQTNKQNRKRIPSVPRIPCIMALNPETLQNNRLEEDRVSHLIYSLWSPQYPECVYMWKKVFSKYLCNKGLWKGWTVVYPVECTLKDPATSSQSPPAGEKLRKRWRNAVGVFLSFFSPPFSFSLYL